jgi:hypothetical protein
MPMVTPSGHASVIESLRLVGDAVDHAVTFGIKINEAAPPTTAELLEVLGSAFNTHVMATMPSQYTHVNTHLEWSVLAPPAPQLIGDRPSDTAGTNPLGNLIPQNSAYLVRKNTALGGRRNRGRMYLPGVPESLVSDAGVLTPVRVTEVTNALEAWRAALVASVAIEEMVILHATSLLSPTPAPTPVTSLVCQPLIATQRRRLR